MYEGKVVEKYDYIGIITIIICINITANGC